MDTMELIEDTANSNAQNELPCDKKDKSFKTKRYENANSIPKDSNSQSLDASIASIDITLYTLAKKTNQQIQKLSKNNKNPIIQKIAQTCLSTSEQVRFFFHLI